MHRAAAPLSGLQRRAGCGSACSSTRCAPHPARRVTAAAGAEAAGPSSSGPPGGDDGSVSSSSKFLRFNKDAPLTHHNPENPDHLVPTELPEHLRGGRRLIACLQFVGRCVVSDTSVGFQRRRRLPRLS